MKSDFPIDVVITWVDGNDPAHRAKRYRYMHGGAEAAQEDIGGETRYRQSGEIFFCVASVLRFAPFVRKIFIVTDNQNPQLDAFLERNFPDNRTPIEIVDHRVLFRGYEQFLPTFNSLTITTMLWRIPGLSEHFVLLNDDVMLASAARAADFFDGERAVVCYANRWPSWWVEVLHFLKPKRGGHKPFGFKDAQFNAQRVAGWHGHFLYMGHTPHMLLKSFFERFFAAHPDILVGQIRHRFRESTQFSAVCLQYISLYMEGCCRIVPLRGRSVCMKPRKGRRNYFENKMKSLDRRGVQFFCVNSLDQASDADRQTLYRHLSEKLDIEIPECLCPANFR